MLGNGVEISSIFHRILGPLALGWAPNHFVLGAQVAPGEKRLNLYPCFQISIKKGCSWRKKVKSVSLFSDFNKKKSFFIVRELIPAC